MTISSKELMSCSGASYRQIDYWTRKGYLEPDNRDVVFSGTARTFDDAELRVAQVLQTFYRGGITISAWGPEFLREAILETSSDEITIGRDDFELTIRLHVDH